MSIVIGTGFFSLTAFFPRLVDNNVFLRAISYVYIFPLCMAVSAGIPATVSIKGKVGKFCLILAVIIIGSVSSLFFYFYINTKPILFDSISAKFTVSFLLVFPFLFFSFFFLFLANTLLINFLEYKYNFVCTMLIIVYSRLVFLAACNYLLISLFEYLRFFLVNYVL
jgi:hypothetical protein